MKKITKATVIALIAPYIAYAYVGRKKRALGMFLIDMAIWAIGANAGFYAGGGPTENPLEFDFSLGFLVLFGIVESWHIWMIMDVRKISKKQGEIANAKSL